MASKTDYYDRIISSFQSDITSQKSEISDLKSTVARLQKEIEALKTSQGVPQQSSEPQHKWITTDNLLLAVKRSCDDVIRTNNEKLPTMFVGRQEFENFLKSTEQKSLAVDTFNTYKKSLEGRLKSIEEKLTHRYTLLTITRHDKNGNSESKSYLNLDSIIRVVRNGHFQWITSIVTFLSIALLALYLISSITN